MITSETVITLIKMCGDAKLSIHRTTEPPQIFLTGWLNTDLLTAAINLHLLNPDFDVLEIVPFLRMVSCEESDAH